MSFVIFTDGCSNLPGSLLERYEIRLLECHYFANGEPRVYAGDIAHFDAHSYYEGLRGGMKITTSLINTQQFLDAFRPVLGAGVDVMYLGLSSGISGTIQAARIAGEELMEKYPGRTVRVVDSLGAGFGVGLLTCLAAEYRNQGLTIGEAGDKLDQDRMHLDEYFIVDDLMFLRGTGRINAATAALGTVLNIKPLLRGDEEGHIVTCAKSRGRKKAIAAIAQQYEKLVREPEKQLVAITHGDCPQDAQALAELINAIAKPRELLILPHEPFTGAHVGPGMLSLFFFGEHR